MKRMTILLAVAWPLLLGLTIGHLTTLRAKRLMNYVVSYQMTTEHGGSLTGFANLSWNANATLPDIQEFIRNGCVEQNKKEGQPTPTGNVVILGVFERPWK